MPEKGPPVFLDYDQAALDAAYDQAAYAPNREQLIKRRISDSELARLRVGEPERVAYGPAEIERLDIYRTRRDCGTGLRLYPWRRLAQRPLEGFRRPRPRCSSPPARIMSCPTSPGCRMSAAASSYWPTRSAARSPGYTAMLSRFGIDPARLYVGGQSSGGHLAAVALTTDWPRDFGLPADIIKGGMCISGMYDLTPVRLSARNAYVAFDDATVAALSPIRHLDRLHAAVIVAYGTCETPEFQRQNREFAAAVENAGKKVRLLVGEHHNHFELPETLGNPYGLLGRAALDLMGLTAGVWSMIRIGLWSDIVN